MCLASKTPTIPETAANLTNPDTSSSTAKDRARRAATSARGAASTLLTGTTGVTSMANVGKKTLLGA